MGEKPAAFLDILAPPYTDEDPDEPNQDFTHKESRHCNFYKVAKQVQNETSTSSNKNTNEPNNKTHWLQIVPTPPDYDCDFEPYKGPTLFSTS